MGEVFLGNVLEMGIELMVYRKLHMPFGKMVQHLEKKNEAGEQ